MLSLESYLFICGLKRKRDNLFGEMFELILSIASCILYHINERSCSTNRKFVTYY